MKRSNKEKDVLKLALIQLDKYYDNLGSRCRSFKWICSDHLSDGGKGYLGNKDIFEIENEVIKGILKRKEYGRKVIMRLINEK